MIPDTWEIILKRDHGMWKAHAKKKEGVREISINTYDEPRPSITAALQLLEKRIMQ